MGERHERGRRTGLPGGIERDGPPHPRPRLVEIARTRRGLAAEPQDHARPDAELSGAAGAAVGTGRHHALQRRLWRLRRQPPSRDPRHAGAGSVAGGGRPQPPCHGRRHDRRRAGVQGPRAGPQSSRHARARLHGSLLFAGDRRGRQAGRRDRRRGRDHRARAGTARDRGAGRNAWRRCSRTRPPSWPSWKDRSTSSPTPTPPTSS